MRDDRCQKGRSTKGRCNACFNHYLYGGIQPDCLSDRFDIRIFHRFSLIRQLDGLVLGLSALFSLILTVNTCLCIFGAKYGSLAILIIFANLGTLMISMIYGLITDPVRNELNGFNILGMVFLPVILALSFFAERKNKQTEETGKQHQHGWKFLMICILIFFFNGSALPVYSAFSTYRGGYGGFNFIFLYLFFCILLCAVALAMLLCLQRKKADPVSNVRMCISTKTLLCMLTYGGGFLLSEFTTIKITEIMPIVVQAPLKFAVDVVMVAMADFLLFKQKITKIQFAQIGLALISGVLFVL